MHAETVKVKGREITVYCTPSTPIAEILRRAAQQADDWDAKKSLDETLGGYLHIR